MNNLHKIKSCIYIPAGYRAFAESWFNVHYEWQSSIKKLFNLSTGRYVNPDMKNFGGTSNTRKFYEDYPEAIPKNITIK